MGIIDYILLTLIAAAVAVILRRRFGGKKGTCSCGTCDGDCARCRKKP